jgi:hypothetical protein
VNKSESEKVMTVIKSFKERFLYSIKAVDKYYVEVRGTLYPDNYTSEQKDKIDDEMRPFLSAYQTMKLVFDKKMRE